MPGRWLRAEAAPFPAMQPSFPNPTAARARALALCCASACALAPAAQAAEPDHPATNPAVLPQLTITSSGGPQPIAPVSLDTPSRTGSLLGLSLRETPAAVTVIDRTLIEQLGAENTQDMLRALPGATAHSAPGNPTAVYRGFSSGSLAQLFNGINVQYSVANRAVDSWIYDRMEAVGGPSSFLYGSGAVGGSINYITKLAEPADFGEARLRLGSNRLREGAIGINRRIAGAADGAINHYARIDLNHRRADGWTDGTHSESTQLATSLLSQLGDGLQHTLAYEYQKEAIDRPYWGTPWLQPVQGHASIDPAMRRKNYNSRDGYYGQRVQWLRSLTEYRASDRLTLNNTFYVYDALRDYRNVESYRLNADNTQVERSGALLQRHDQRLVGNRVDAVYHGSIAGLQSDWALGLDYSVNRQTRFPNSINSRIDQVDPYDFTTESFWDVPGMTPGFTPDRTVRLKTAAVYLENRTRLTPDLQLLTGLRHERIAMALTNRRAITASNPAYYRRTYTPTTGRIGLSWEAVPGFSTYVQYATAADPPEGALSTATFANAINNSDLTTGRQIEVGAKSEFWHGRGSATVAMFHITRKNIASRDPDDNSRTLLVGEQSAKGVELTMGLQPTTRLSLMGNAAWVDAQYEHYVQNGVSLAGKSPSNTPEVVANLWASYQLLPQWQVGVGLRHVGKAYADAANTIVRDGYTLLDLSSTWDISEAMQLVARIRNATDRVYALDARANSAYLGAPRAFDLSLHVRF